MKADEKWVLQFCHSYNGPFMDCARQYSALFEDTDYKVCTVYLTGVPRREIETGTESDDVIFLNYSSRQVRGLKLGAIRDIRRIARGRNFKFCIAHRFKPIYVALLGTKLPVIGVHHAFGGYKRVSRRFFANIFKKRLALLAVSNAVRDDMRYQLRSWHNDRIATLYNRINIKKVQSEQLSKEVARKELNLPQNAWIVGNVGRFHPDKDQETLIRGFARALPKLPSGSLLTIMGSGRLESFLKQLAFDLGINDHVRFLGQVPQGRRYFKAFDVFALTSDHEPFGMVLLEAMAAGVPIVCSDCGGGKEVTEGSGWLFELGNISDFCQCLEAIVTTKYNEGVSKRLFKNFSDDAAKHHFWQLPAIKSITSD